MKIAFIIGCHNKIDDLMLYLDTLKYCPFPHETIIIHTMDYDEKYMEVIRKYHHKRIEGYGHHIGPLLCAIEGLREAHKLECQYSIYNNSDDITHNFEWIKSNFDLMESQNYLIGAYNWMSVGVYHDITLNQLYLNVPQFYETSYDAENYFLHSPKQVLCEFKMTRWVKRTCKNLEKEFYRLPDREQLPGIGWEAKDIVKAFERLNRKIPLGFWEKLDKNNRFFNEKWQMIGSHDNYSRLVYWKRIRNQVPYAENLEKEYHFSRFLIAAKNNEKWNINCLPEVYIPASNKTIIYRRKIL